MDSDVEYQSTNMKSITEHYQFNIQWINFLLQSNFVYALVRLNIINIYLKIYSNIENE